IDIIFVEQRVVHALEGFLHLGWLFGVFAVEPPCDGEADQRSYYRNGRKRELRCVRRSFGCGCFGAASGFACCASENRLSELREVVGAAPETRRGEPSADYREQRQKHQRNRHAVRRFVHVDVMLVKARLAVEREEDQPEHVERSEQGSEQADGVKNVTAVWILKSAEQDGVFTEEACQRGN